MEFPDCSKSLNESLVGQSIEIYIYDDLIDTWSWHPCTIGCQTDPIVLSGNYESENVDEMTASIFDAQNVELSLCCVNFPDDQSDYQCSFLHNNLVIFDVDCNEIDDVHFTYWRFVGSGWCPVNDDANEFLMETHKPELSSREEIENFVNEVLSDCIQSKTLRAKMDELPRDAMCMVTDTITSGRVQMIDGIEQFLTQKRQSDPHYEMKIADFKSLLAEIKPTSD